MLLRLAAKGNRKRKAIRAKGAQKEQDYYGI